MALGKRRPVEQPLFITTASLNTRAHPFYGAVNQVFDAHGFDRFVVQRCARFYAATMGRPGLTRSS